MAFRDVVDDVNSTLTNLRGEWNVYDMDTGNTIASFTSFVSITVSGNANITDYPVETGFFTSVNKTNEPDDITVVFAKGGSRESIRETLESLRPYKEGTALVSVVTPYQSYLNMNITSYDYSHTAENGAGLLEVTIRMREIREVTPEYSFEKVNPRENSSIVDVGKKQAVEIDNRSVALQLQEAIRDFLGGS